MYIELCRVLVFKEPPVVIYSDINKMIGKPKDLEKNMENPENFSVDVDLTIPLMIKSSKLSEKLEKSGDKLV